MDHMASGGCANIGCSDVADNRGSGGSVMMVLGAV